MPKEEYGYRGWTENELVRETVSNLESLEGVESVEWQSQSKASSQYHDLIRVRTYRGRVLRLAIAFCLDEEMANVFDDSFPPPPRGAGSP